MAIILFLVWLGICGILAYKCESESSLIFGIIASGAFMLKALSML